MDFRDTFRSLRHRNYRLFIYGQGISLVGTWMQQVAMGWLVYRLTGSAFLIGMVSFWGQLPIFLLSPVAGVLADRHNRRNMLIGVQTLAMFQAAMLSVLVLTGAIQVWHIVALGFLLGLVNSFDMPVRQSFMIEMVGGREDLTNAIALNSSVVNLARLIGPSIAGVIIAAAGEGICFALNAASYLAVIYALTQMTINKKAPPKDSRVLNDIKQGFRYIRGVTPLKSTLMLLAMVSLTGMSFQVLMPIYAKDILHGGPKLLGFLMGSVGIGSLSAAIYIASQKRLNKLWNVLPCATLAFGTCLIALSLSKSIMFSLMVMPFLGASMMTQIASSNTLIQSITHDSMRGRVMAFYAMSFTGMAPIGSLLSGSLAGAFGTRNAMLINGTACLISAFLARKLPGQIREHYAANPSPIVAA